MIALGAHVREYRLGDQVMTALRRGIREEVTVPTTAVRSMPSRFSFTEAATFRSAFSTAYHALVQGGRLQPGETALIHGAAGGVGLAAVQIAKQLGAKVIALASDPAKFSILRQFGADHVFTYSASASPEESDKTQRSCSFRDAVKSSTDGQGVDVVFDPVGGDVF